MKQLVISFLLSMSSFSLCAQVQPGSHPAIDSPKATSTNSFQIPDDVRYRLPNGKLVERNQLDSVIKSWGGGRYQMSHREDQPGIYTIFPSTAAARQQSADEKVRMNSMLNQTAPDFTLTTLSGKIIHLADLKGKTVVLNFWFIACAPCREEMPQLNKIVQQFENKKVVFLGLPLDGFKAVNAFLATHIFNYLQLPYAQKVHADYKVISCPASMVIDKSGIIRFVQSTGQDINSTLPGAISSSL